MRGVSTEAGRAARSQTAAVTAEKKRETQAVKTESDKAAAHDRRLRASWLRETQRAYREQTAEARKAAREKERLEKQASNVAIREAKRVAREQATAAAKAAREAASTAAAEERRRRRRNTMIGAGAIGGVLAGGASVAQRVGELGQAYGFRSQGELLSAGIRIRQESIRLGAQAGLDPENIAKQVTGTSAKYGLEAEDVLGAVSGAQAKFNNAASVVANLDTLGKIAHATGASMADVVDSSSEMQRQFGLSDEAARDMAFAMADVAKKGSVDFVEVAQNFRDTFGEVQRATGLTGERGAKFAVGLAETLGEGGINPAESATMVKSMMRSLNDPETRKRLADAGVQVAEGKGNTGKLLDPETVLRSIAASNLGSDQVAAGKVFTERTARQGFGVVSSLLARDPKAFETYMRGDAAAGKKYISDLSGKLLADPTGEASTARARQLSEFVASGATDNFTTALNSTLAPLETFKAQFPELTLAAGVAKDALLGVAAASGAAALLTKGAGAGALGAALPGAAGAAGAGAAGAAGAAAGASALAMAAGGIAAGAAGFLGTTAVLRSTGLDKSLEARGASLAGDGTGIDRGSVRGLGTKAKPMVVQFDREAVKAFADVIAAKNPDIRRTPGGPRGRQ